MLGIIVFCLVFGYFISKIHSHTSAIILGFWKGVFQIMMQITHLVMKALPIGVFGLVAKAIATTGPGHNRSRGLLFYHSPGRPPIYALIILPFLLKFIARGQSVRLFPSHGPRPLSQHSRQAHRLPRCQSPSIASKRGRGFQTSISSFILPLGTSVNLSGSALYVCAGVIFIAQAYGVHLSIPSLCVVVLFTLLTSLGSAGIPSASMISIVVILQALGLPAMALV